MKKPGKRGTRRPERGPIARPATYDVAGLAVSFSRLPAVPATAGASCASASEDEAQRPDHEHDDRDPPERLERETRAEEDESQQQDQYQRNHCYYLPGAGATRGKREQAAPIKHSSRFGQSPGQHWGRSLNTCSRWPQTQRRPGEGGRGRPTRADQSAGRLNRPAVITRYPSAFEIHIVRGRIVVSRPSGVRTAG